MVKCKSVFSPRVARRLIREGYRVADIKPSKENRDKTIFLFEETPEFTERLGEFFAESAMSASEISDAGVEVAVIG